MEFEILALDNGIRLVHKQVSGQAAHFGLTINAGSRDELPDEHGLAHFIEHVFFKGTHKRKAHQVLSRIEDVGGEINAFTTKEETCIFSSFLFSDYPRAIELIADIVFNASFPLKELEKEKAVIADEINSYKDNPAEQIFDQFDELFFGTHSLGRNILGSKASLKRFNPNHIQRFINDNYATADIIISSVGNISFDRISRLANRYFGHVPVKIKLRQRLPFDSYLAQQLELRKRTYQSHCVMGNQAYNFGHPYRMGMYLLNNYLGGPGFSSLLNIALRERNGLCYNVESAYSPFRDNGIFTVYFGTDRENIGKSIEIIEKEFRKLREQLISPYLLHKLKKQVIGQLALSSENYESLMLGIGKSLLVFGQVDTFDTVVNRIESISREELREIANQVLDMQSISRLVYL